MLKNSSIKTFLKNFYFNEIFLNFILFVFIWARIKILEIKMAYLIKVDFLS